VQKVGARSLPTPLVAKGGVRILPYSGVAKGCVLRSPHVLT